MSPHIVVPTKLAENATEPKFMSEGAAAMDIYSLSGGEPIVLMPQQVTLIKTGVSMAIPRGFYAQIASRSGWCLKKTIWAVGGVIDSDYRGDIGVLMYNGGTSPVELTPGDRIAQLIFLPCEMKGHAHLQLCVELPDSQRGEGGFGSTGIKN